MINPHDQQLYAVKELTNLTLEDGSTDKAAMFELLEEVRKMGVVDSQFVVQYRTSAVHCGRFYVMMELIASVLCSGYLCTHSYKRRRCARESWLTSDLQRPSSLSRAMLLLRSKESTTATL